MNMASSGPVASAISKIPLRRNGPRTPRKLDYLKCDQCRKAKVKCIPQEGSRAEECIRCFDKKRACSGPRTKAAAQSQLVLKSQIIAPLLTQNEANNGMSDRDLLILLSLQHIINLALQELLFIGEEQLLPIKGDTVWLFNHKSLMDIHLEYSENAEIVGKMIRSTGHVPPSVLLASWDIRYGKSEDKDVVDRYSRKGHHGIAFILQMQNLRPRSSDAVVEKMLASRENFMRDVAQMLDQYRLNDTLSLVMERLDFMETQLFIPRHLFANKMLVQAIRQDGRKDILYRSVDHMVHDNTFRPDYTFIPRTDDEDVLGRSSLHIACAMSLQERHSRGIVLILVDWPGGQMLGLDALEIAAIRGHVDVFRTTLSSGLNMRDHLRKVWLSDSGRTYLHWSAYNGHVDLARVLIEAAEDRNVTLKRFLAMTDEGDQSPLMLAASNGHSDIVALLMRCAQKLLTPEDLFIEAIQGRHLDVMKLLEPSTDLNYVDILSGMTALAIAAWLGFADGVRFLLDKEVNLNPTCRCYNTIGPGPSLVSRLLWISRQMENISLVWSY